MGFQSISTHSLYMKCIFTFSKLLKPAIPFASFRFMRTMTAPSVYRLRYVHAEYDENGLFRFVISPVKVMPMSFDSAAISLTEIWHNLTPAPLSVLNSIVCQIKLLYNLVIYSTISIYFSILVRDNILHKWNRLSFSRFFVVNGIIFIVRKRPLMLHWFSYDHALCSVLNFSMYVILPMCSESSCISIIQILFSYSSNMVVNINQRRKIATRILFKLIYKQKRNTI